MNSKKTTMQFEPFWREYLLNRVEMLRLSSQEANSASSQIDKAMQRLKATLSSEQIKLFNDYDELNTAQECDFEYFLYEEAFRDAFRWSQFFQKK